MKKIRMTSKLVKCSIYIFLKEAMVRLHLSLVRMPTRMKKGNRKCCWGWGEKACFLKGNGSANHCIYIGNKYRVFSKNRTITSIDPIIPPLGMHSKESIVYNRDSYTSLFTAALLTIARMGSVWTSTSRLMGNENAVHMHSGILFRCKE